MRTVTIAGRPIGPDHEPYIICELSGNHMGSLDRALAMIDAAAETGCDAIKLQTYTADTVTLDSDRPEFVVSEGLWTGRSIHSLYHEAHTPYEWHPALFERARKRGVTIFSTPFDETAIELLASLDAPAYKIASFEHVDLPLIEAVARQGRPMIMSRGMATLAETHEAVETARRAGCEEIILLHCISAYPAPIEDANVRTVPHLSQAFDVVAGLSDHTPGSAAAVASIVLGGSVIEKHFTLRRADGGPDAEFSMEPEEFTLLVRDCKAAWRALGTVNYGIKGGESVSLTFRRSLYATKPIKAGEVFTKDNVRSVRPGYGLAPKELGNVLGRTARRDIAFAEPLAWDMIDR